MDKYIYEVLELRCVWCKILVGLGLTAVLGTKEGLGGMVGLVAVAPEVRVAHV